MPRPIPSSDPTTSSPFPAVLQTVMLRVLFVYGRWPLFCYVWRSCTTYFGFFCRPCCSERASWSRWPPGVRSPKTRPSARSTPPLPDARYGGTGINYVYISYVVCMHVEACVYRQISTQQLYSCAEELGKVFSVAPGMQPGGVSVFTRRSRTGCFFLFFLTSHITGWTCCRWPTLNTELEEWGTLSTYDIWEPLSVCLFVSFSLGLWRFVWLPRVGVIR